MSNEKDLLINTLNLIHNNTELFYQQKKSEGYAMMQQTVEKITEIVNVLHNYKEVHQELPYDEVQVLSSLSEVVEAMENKDTVLLSDILEYDFVEYLQGVADAME